jgi:hypothetical protein
VLAGTANFDNLRRHSDEECRTHQSSTAVPFLQRNCVIESADRVVARVKLRLDCKDESLNRNPLLQ